MILKDGKLSDNNSIHSDEIKEILGLHPIESIAPEAAHIKLLKLGVRWHTTRSMVYNKKNARMKTENAKDFLKTAQYNLAMKYGAHLWKCYLLQQNSRFDQFCREYIYGNSRVNKSMILQLNT